MSMGPLPNLPALQGLGAGASNTGAVTPEAATGVGSAAADLVTGGFSGFVSWLSSGKGICVIIGLLLIIAGLFQFKSVREVTGYASKGAVLAA